AELRERVTTCPLTGLANRAGFLDLVEEALAVDEPLAVGLLDLDDFKGVNDTLGHEAGDALLVKVAARIRNATGARDVVGRLGGDEFALLLRGNPSEVEAKADRVVEALRLPLLVDGHELLVAGGLVGCEALARWVRKGRPPEPPGEWMELAEQSGLIVDIDHALMSQALRDFAEWRAVSPDAREMELALNVSGRTLQAAGTADH